MISARPHRLPKRVPVALDDMRQAAGTQYDPAVVDALVRVVENTNWKGPGFSLRHHVLIVDPDETRAMVTATRLCSHGYLAEAVFQIDAAVDRLEKTRIVAIIVSSELPGADEALFYEAGARNNTNRHDTDDHDGCKRQRARAPARGGRRCLPEPGCELRRAEGDTRGLPSPRGQELYLRPNRAAWMPAGHACRVTSRTSR